MSTKYRRADLKLVEGMRNRFDAASIKRDFLFNLFCRQAKFSAVATRNDHYLALAYTVHDRMLHRWIRSARSYFEQASRTVAYLSAEFLIGPQLAHNLMMLGMYNETEKAMRELGISLSELVEHEEEPGLGNGGLGRLAACYMDSLATLRIPTIGYGIRYEFGIFEQKIIEGQQVEDTDNWLRYGYPWEVARPEIEISVKLGGRTESHRDEHGRHVTRWVPERVVKGVPYDTVVLGYGVENANMLRLWQAAAAESLDLAAFNVGDYYRAVREKVISENITKVLYPNDQSEAGKILRLEQEYFFVSCSLQDMIRIHLQRATSLDHFHEKYALQLNDTHPALAVAELMRLFLDEHHMEWDKAWDITVKCTGYTNHTLLPEALEAWPLPMFKRILPRHLDIIYEINKRFLDVVRLRYPEDEQKLTNLSLIDEWGEKRVRMAHLACVGSHAINGVAELHTDLLKKTVLADFAEFFPERFSNKTNGVTPRRFMRLANPGLDKLLTEQLGDGWVKDLDQLRQLKSLVDDQAFVDKLRAVKRANKTALAAFVKQTSNVTIDPESLFDVHVKRIHEYKRQHLNVLHVVAMYRRIKEGRTQGMVPRTVLFAGKAAPGYTAAKLIIKLIHDVANSVNRDPSANQWLRVVFVPDFSVKNAQRIYPAADLSEQISTAGKEASGTGNMKFAMNGALTIGTLDGANIEIREEVGAENFFLFGLNADEVIAKKAAGYRPRDYYEGNTELRGAVDMIASGFFSRGDKKCFAPLVESLLEHDPYLLFADFASYLDAQGAVATAYADVNRWSKMVVNNLAQVGKFSSDRSIQEYCDEIWKISPVDILEI